MGVFPTSDIVDSRGHQKTKQEWILPRFFPATVVKNSDKRPVLYLAGDFQIWDWLGSPRFTGLAYLVRGFHLVIWLQDREGFYWNYYFPLNVSILQKLKNRNYWMIGSSGRSFRVWDYVVILYFWILKIVLVKFYYYVRSTTLNQTSILRCQKSK